MLIVNKSKSLILYYIIHTYIHAWCMVMVTYMLRVKFTHTMHYTTITIHYLHIHIHTYTTVIHDYDYGIRYDV
jgi:hypothetical protein